MRAGQVVRQDGPVSTRQGSKARRGVALVAALLLGVLMTGCGPDHPLERLADDRAASADVVVAAEAFAGVLADLEDHVGVATAAAGAPADARSTVAALVDPEMDLGNQARAFFEGHTSQVERETRTVDLTDADVSVVDVTEADDQDGPVTLVTLDTVRTPVDGTPTTTRASYALSWGSPDAPDPGSTSGSSSEPTAGATDAQGPAETDDPGDATPDDSGTRLVLEQVRAVHDDDGHHALVDPTSGDSALGVASDYVRALRSGTDREVDAFEGGVRSSSDLRDAMRSRLTASGRMTPVEVPCGRTGSVQVVYVILDGDVPPLRLEVDVSGDSPVVNAYL